MADMYSPESRSLQDQFDTRRLADRLREVKVHDRFTEDDRAFLEQVDMFFLATVDASGRPTCSYKGGAPGFVAVLDDQTLAFPNYDGRDVPLGRERGGNRGRGVAVHRLRAAAADESRRDRAASHGRFLAGPLSGSAVRSQGQS